MSISSLSKLIGSALILVGLGGYYLTGAESMTALIPAYLGFFMGIFGYIGATRPNLNKHMMHGAVLVALVGLIGTATAIPALFSLMGGAEVSNPPAVIARSITAVLCIVYISVAVKSFIDARKSLAKE